MDAPLPRPGPRNLISDVPGLTVGNATDESVKSGVTVLRCAESFVAAVDVRGGGPATRETDVLDAGNLVGRADAIVFSGGSVFGLAAADGVTQFLSTANVGLRLAPDAPVVPIAPAAALYDLGNDGDKNWKDGAPYARLGAMACESAGEDFALGSVGAGRGAMAGGFKGGLGSASIVLDDGALVAALVAVNPVGSPYLPDGETFYAWPWEIGGEFGGGKIPQSGDVPDPFPPGARIASPGNRKNTTLAVVATSADLNGAEAKRIAIMAHDGIARAIRPAHTLFDGDVVFSVATAATPLAIDNPPVRALAVSAIGAAAADCVTRAIARSVYHAAH